MENNIKEGKIIIISAPSGTGKSTIIKQLFEDDGLRLGFSISATCRQPRQGEVDGKDYYFITREEFEKRVAAGEFVEWEEVYPGTCYGTLSSEVERITSTGCNLIMDIDVKGALNVKKYYGDSAVSIFIMPPSVEELSRRLHGRGTDSEETIAKRLAKAEFEMSFSDKFDHVVVNDELANAVKEVSGTIKEFLK